MNWEYVLFPHCGTNVVHSDTTGVLDNGAPWTDFRDENEFGHARESRGFVFCGERKVAIACFNIEASGLPCDIRTVG